MTNGNGSAVRAREVPSSVEAEESLLATIFSRPDRFLDVASFVAAPDFFLVRNGWIWEAMERLTERNDDINTITVMGELKACGLLEDIGGLAHLAYLANAAPDHDHAETFARLIRKAAIRRRLLTAMTQAAQVALEDNKTVDAIIDEVWSLLDEAADYHTGSSLMSFGEAADAAMDEWLAWTQEPSMVRGYRTGISSIDTLVGGFLPGRVASIIQPTSSGKSTFSRQLFVALVNQGPGLIATTEVDPKAFVHALVTQELGLDPLAIQRGMDSHDIAAKYGENVKRNAFMVKGDRPTIGEIERHARKLRRRFGARPLWLIVDSGSNVGVSGTENLFEITRRVINKLSGIARDYQFFVFVTWQVNRASYKDEETSITAGRGGGDIENDSDYVFTIERPEYKWRAGLVKPPAAWQPTELEKAIFRCLKSRHNPISGRKIDLWFKLGTGFYAVDNTAEGD